MPRPVCPTCGNELGDGWEPPINCMTCAGFIDGRAEERAKIVAWLRDPATTGSKPGEHYASVFADRLERGEHESECQKMGELQKKIEHELNCACAENGSNTPDYILAEYLMASLAAFDAAVRKRDAWRSPPKQENT